MRLAFALPFLDVVLGDGDERLLLACLVDDIGPRELVEQLLLHAEGEYFFGVESQALAYLAGDLLVGQAFVHPVDHLRVVDERLAVALEEAALLLPVGLDGQHEI